MRASEVESHGNGKSSLIVEFHTVPWDLILESHSQVLYHLRNHHEIDVLNTIASQSQLNFNVQISSWDLMWKSQNLTLKANALNSMMYNYWYRELNLPNSSTSVGQYVADRTSQQHQQQQHENIFDQNIPSTSTDQPDNDISENSWHDFSDDDSDDNENTEVLSDII